MGNMLLLDQYRKGDPSEGYERWLQQNPDLVGKEILSENKLFRVSSYTINGRHIILKTFFKKESEPISEYIKLFENFNRNVEQYRVMNIVPLKLIPPPQKSSFVVAYRQKMQTTLEDVVLAQPSPNYLKKKWIIYQMIQAVVILHRKFNFYHGHIRSSNFISTSYGYLMLTDFGFYKPLYMFEDSEKGLPQFRLFYGSSTENCTVAPEKMKERSESHTNKLRTRSPAKAFSNMKVKKQYKQLPQEKDQKSNNARPKQVAQIDKQQIQQIDNVKNLQKMDIFSLGCTILEILREGKPSLQYETLLKLKRKEFSLENIIKDAVSRIINPEQAATMMQLLKCMTSLDPDQRPLIEEIQKTFNSLIDLDTYELFFYCLAAFGTSSFHLPDLRICLIYSIFKSIESEQRKSTNQFKIRLPRCLESFNPLQIFKSLIKNKVIYVDEIREGTILDKIINSADKESKISSDDEQIIADYDRRRQFFVPQKLKRITSVRMSTTVIPKFEKILCPPQWDRSLMKLIEMKIKGTNLTKEQITRNRLQDMLQQYKKNQFLREIRKQQSTNFYEKLSMMIRVIYSCLRGCKFVDSQLLAIEMIMFIARETSDEIKLMRVLPYLMSLLDVTDIVVAKYALNSIIDLFYLFIDPFQNEEQTSYYQVFLQTMLNNIKNSRLRMIIFQRLSEIYEICEWLEIHILKLGVNMPENSIEKLILIIKLYYGNFNELQIRELIVNMPTIIWAHLFEFFISFINTQKILGLEKSITIVDQNTLIHKNKFDIIDSCVESALEENGLTLFYAIKYFTKRRISTINISRKIAPMVIHPHLWVREEAQNYIRMCLEDNPPTRIFFLFYQIFEPPFPLQPKDLYNQYLLPEPLKEKDVDFIKKEIRSSRRIGLTENKFLEYMKNVKTSKNFVTTRENEVEKWNKKTKSIADNKVEPLNFAQYIKKSIENLLETNFLFCIGNTNFIYRLNCKQQQKRLAYAELNDNFRRLKFSYDDKLVTNEKKQFFFSLLTYVNTNFEKLLVKSIQIKEQEKGVNAINKVSVSENLYLIMDILYKFDQFQIRQTTRLGEYQRKSLEPDKLARPKGQLITEIYEHRDVVTCLQNIADNFLISGSYDGTIKVFNLKKIQMNVTTDSQVSYQINSQQNEDKVKINTISAFANTTTFAAGTNKGQIRLYQVERMPSKGYEMNKPSKADNFEIMKYYVGGQIQKIITCSNDKMNQCFCFLSAEGTLGVQDIRMKSKTIVNNLGKERGMPKSLTFSSMGPSLLIGTLDGYILTYDIRCNIISNIKQLMMDQQPLTVTGIYESPHGADFRPLFAVTYPSKHYEFSYFDIYEDGAQVLPVKHYSSSERDEIICLPTMQNKTKQENFKLCSNSLSQKLYYKQLPDFNRNFKILQYLADPFTIKESKIREVWMNRCKHRYNQIYSIYNKKSLPFIEHLSGSILTNLNPTVTSQIENRNNKNLCMLVEKRENKDYNEIQKPVYYKPKGSIVHSFQQEQNSDYLTCCSVFPNMVAVGGWDSIIKIYK